MQSRGSTISALEAFKCKIVLEGVSHLQTHSCLLDDRKTHLLAKLEEQYGGGNGRNDVGRNHQGNGRTKVP
jgi:hypothetical protein